QLKEVELNEGIQKIGGGLVLECRSLDRIRFPSTVTGVGEEVFSRCNELKEVELNEGLQKIGGSEFLECPSLDSIRFPSTVTEVDESEFSDCSGLKKVELNEDEGLQKIGENSF
ncbi:hypothetical protein ACHAXR_010915, partial [Thalassiosira sp. AJA248-18]